MATVTGYTAAHMETIKNSTVISGEVDSNGDLILTTRGGSSFNAGHVKGVDFDIGSVPNASESSIGVVRLATAIETSAGTRDDLAVSPKRLMSIADLKAELNHTHTVSQITDYVSQTQYMIQEAMNGVPPADEDVPGTIEIATPAEAVAGTNHTKAVTPLGLKTAINTLAPSGHTHTLDQIEVVGLPQGADLDTFTTQGFYAENSNNDAAAGLNYPTPNAGLLEVRAYGTGFIFQTYTGYSGQGTWKREKYNSNWQPWRKVDGDGTPTRWSDISNIPSTFPPSSHGHALTDSNITGIIPDGNLPARLRPAAVSDINDASSTGWYTANNADNAPVATSIGFVHTMRTGNNARQWFYRIYDGDERVWSRTGNVSTNVWTAWTQVDNTAINWGSLSGVPSSFPPSSHNHSASDITSGTLAVSRGGTGATSLSALYSALGLLPASVNPDPSTMVTRASNGMFNVNTPTSASHAANKGYVDSVANASITLPTVKAGGFTISVWNRNITGNRRAAWITDANAAPTELGHTASSERYKQDIEELDVSDESVLQMAAVIYRYIEQVQLHGEDAPWDFGMIAERLVDADIPWAVFYNEDGTPEGIHYERAWLALLPSVKRLLNRVSELESTIESFESRLAALEG